MIQVFINDTEIDTFENTGIGITYQSSTLISLELRGGHFTNQFSIPLTAKNKLIFENAHITNSDTNLPYLNNSCSIVMDGLEVLSDGVLNIESISDEKIEVSVLGGNSDFFNVIKNLNLNDLDFSAYKHDLTTNDIEPLTSTTEGLLYPLMDWDNVEGSINNSGVLVWFPIGLQLPVFYLKTILDLISKLTGWSISGNLLTDEGFLKKTLSCNRYLKHIDDTNVNSLNRITTDNTFYTATHGYGSKSGNFIRTDITLSFNENIGDWTISNAIILCEKSTNYELTYNWNMEFLMPIGFRSAVAIRWCEVDSGGTYIEECLWHSQDYDFIFDSKYKGLNNKNIETITVNETMYSTYYFEEGKYYKPFLYYSIDTTTTPSGTYDITFKMLKETSLIIQETTTLCPLDTVDCSELYDVKITDFIKDIVKLFGVNLQANSISKELVFDLFEKLDGETENWSEKLAINKGVTIGFKYGNYAQKNYMKFKGDLDDDSTFFNVEDFTLSKSTTAFEISVTNTIPFNLKAASPSYEFLSCKAKIYDTTNRLSQPQENRMFWNGSIDLVPKIEGINAYFIDIVFATPLANKHRLAFIGSDSIVFSPGDLYYKNISTSVAYGRTISLDNIKTDYYKVLIKMLSKVKVVSCYLNLSAFDIYNLNFRKSKHLLNQMMNDNFYLAKVENFKSGKPTKCTFIKI